ncbi:MAG: CGNR zinc finger domain-containing protein [Gemmatimonadota bacterium]
MNLTSYADLAVRLVNAESDGPGRRGGLATADSYHALMADRPHLNGPVTQTDLESLRVLRDELRRVFASVAGGADGDAVRSLNALLIQHPIQPQISGHDGQDWHLHLTESGTVADRYAAGAVFGLTATVNEIGLNRLRVCAAGSCRLVFIDTTPDRSRRHCSDRCLGATSVTTLRARRRRREAQQPPAASG